VFVLHDQPIIIAIDGPAGSGKSTTARLVAKKLGFLYIDSGAIYRAVTLQILRKRVKLNESEKLKSLLTETDVRLKDAGESMRVILNGEDVTTEIRSADVTARVSEVSENEYVRQEVTEKLRAISRHRSVVLDGRDIGTVVFPEAQVKVFLQATLAERARRRFTELQTTGENVELSSIESDIARRDKIDSTRAIAPLQKAKDAIVLDTTKLTLQQGVDFIVQQAQKFCKT